MKLGPARVLLSECYNWYPRLFDINHNGVIDLIRGINWGDIKYWFEPANLGMTSSNQFIVTNTTGAVMDVRSVTEGAIVDFGDLNGDGYPNLVIGGHNNGNNLFIAYSTNQPSGQPTFSPSLASDNPTVSTSLSPISTSSPFCMPSKRPSYQLTLEPIYRPSEQPSSQFTINPDSRPLTQLDGLCSLIKSTNIGSSYAEYQCTLSSNGIPQFTTDPCGDSSKGTRIWTGLTCDDSKNIIEFRFNQGGSVFNNISLSGSLPNNLGSMVYLRGFLCPACGFSGTIPQSIGNLVIYFYSKCIKIVLRSILIP